MGRLEFVEAVDIDAPRTNNEYLAKLTMERSEVESRFGLRFAPVVNDLGPATLALARLSTGALIGFAKLEYDPKPGVDVVQYTDRPPREVVAELLAETGLTHRDLSWMNGGFPGEEEVLVARSLAEARLYLTSSFDEGAVTVPAAKKEPQVEPSSDGWVMRLRDRTVVVPPEPPGGQPAGSGNYGAGDAPSTLIDAGQWRILEQRAVRRAHQMLEECGDRRPTSHQYNEVHELLRLAAEAADEIVKFLPSGADTVPVKAFWTPAGQVVLRQQRDGFRGADLEMTRVGHQRAIAEFSSVYGPLPGEATATVSPPLSRSTHESLLYMDFHVCACGEQVIHPVGRTRRVGGRWQVTYKGRCVACRRRRKFVFTVAEGNPGAPLFQWSNRRQPSQLIDPGEWLIISDGFVASDARDNESADPGDEQDRRRRTDLQLASAAISEALLFVPPGADAVPVETIRSDRGRAVLAAEPARLRWSELLAARDRLLAAAGPVEPGPQAWPMPARSITEAILFMELHHCVCGADHFERSVRKLPILEAAGRRRRLETLRYEGDCWGCGRRRAFVFTVPLEPSEPPWRDDPTPMRFGFSYPGNRPSALLDAGQYWSAGEMYAEVGEGIAGTVRGAWDEDTWEHMLECLASAVAAVDEVLSFIPLGANRVPAEAFRTPTGRTQHRRKPELFARGRLMRERAQRQQRLDAFVATVPEPGDD